MLEMMFALGGMFFFGALTGWVADHLPDRPAEWMEIQTTRNASMNPPLINGAKKTKPG